MDEVVALSSLLRARQHDDSPSPAQLDAIPPLTRSLPQVHADSTRLLSARVASAATPPTAAVHPAAVRLFASVGFEVDRLRRAVAAVDTAASFVDAPPRPHGPHRHPAWLAPRALDDARLVVNDALRKAARDHMQNDLVRANASLVQRLSALVDRGGRVDGGGGSPTPHTPTRTRSTRRESGRSEGVDTTAVALAMDGRYVEVMRAIALHGEGPSAPFLMHEAAASIPDNPHFVEALAVLASVARNAEREKPPADNVVVWGARVVLEDQFAEQIPGLPQKPRLAAPEAVVPAVREYVKALRARGKLASEDRKGTRDGRRENRGGGGVGTFWAQVYYCLRVGNVDAALMVLQAADDEQHPHAPAVSQFFHLFLQGQDHARSKFRQSHGSRRAERDVMETENEEDEVDEIPMTPGYLIGEKDYEALETLYTTDALTSNDPYMRACLVLLMRLELLSTYATPAHNKLPGGDANSPHSPADPCGKYSVSLPDTDMAQLFGSVEDYLWFRLWLCRTSVESEAMSCLSGFSFVSLEDIQGNILSCGSTHFDPNGSQPLVYAFVLLCCGLYDTSVAHLAENDSEDSMHCGLHLAVVLYQLRWIQKADAFHGMLSAYVSLFSSLFPTEAALYLLTVLDKEALQKLLHDLMIDTGEFKILLGNMQRGTDQPGTLLDLISSATAELPSQYSQSDAESLRVEVAMEAASDAASKGDYASAAELYRIADKQDKSAEMTLQSLAEVAHQRSSPRRSLALAEAQAVANTLRSGERAISPHVAKSLEALIKMARVFQEYWVGRYGTAWAMLRTVDVLPLHASAISDCKRDLWHGAERYQPCMQTCTRELLKAALDVAERALEIGCVETDDDQGDSLPEDVGTIPPIEGTHSPSPRASEIKTLCIFAGLTRITDAVVSERLVRIELALS